MPCASAPREMARQYSRIAASESESRARAEALAAEQSVEMPVAAIGEERVLREVVASVEEIRPHAGHFEVVLGIAPPTTGNEASQLLNMLFGNCSLQPEIELIDVELPEGFERTQNQRCCAFRLIGRLRAGVAVTQAADEADRLAKNSRGGAGGPVASVHGTAAGLRDQLTRTLRPSLLVLFAAVP